MDFITSLLVLTNWKDESYNLILIIINCLIKIVHYKPVKVTINRPDLVKVIISVVVHHHSILNSIVIDQGLLFISKFWSLLCYFLSIKKRLFMTFYPQINS